MSQVTITVEIDGKEHDIKDCFWTVVEPCGCTGAAMTTKHYVNGVGEVGYLTNEEMAWADFYENRAVREQEKARGVKLQLIAGNNYMDVMTKKCEHTPMWGQVALPEGKSWGHASGRVVHVVDDRADDEGRLVYRTALCTGKRDLFEVGPSALHKKPMCKQCLKEVAR